MRALPVALVIAAVLTFAVYPALPDFIHPPICGTLTADGVDQGTFCATWDSQTGHYDIPAGIPGDIARHAWDIDPAELAALIFVGTTAVLWAVFAVTLAVIATDGRSRARRAGMRTAIALASVAIILIAGRQFIIWSTGRGASWDTAFLVACGVAVYSLVFARVVLALRPSVRV